MKTIEQEARAALRAFLMRPRMTDDEANKIANGYEITAVRIRDEETAREHAEANGGKKFSGGFFLENLINDHHVLALLVTGDFERLAIERNRILEETTQQILELFK